MHKIALVTRHSLPDWVSCRSISTNLQTSYKLLPNYNFKNFYFDPLDSAYHGRRVALEIADWEADRVIFLDHAPHPGPVFQFWQEEKPQYKPECIIHVYGDFSLNAGNWIDCEKSLSYHNVQFFCASLKQAQMMSRFFTQVDTANSIQVVPFPVNNKTFFSDDALRLQARKNLSLDQETVLLYSGRLSLQKNILQLIRSFEMYQRLVNPNSTLLLAGPFDDLGNPYLGKTPPMGLMNYDVQTLLQKLFTNDRRKKVQYLGSLQSSELNQIYNAADVFVSLSTHHDEDFGMAPAEAMLTGIPCVLTNWGGYSNFKTYSPDQVKLVPVQLMNGFVVPKETDVLKSISFMVEQKKFSRQTLAQKSSDQLSIEALATLLDARLSQKNSSQFFSFSPLFRRLAQSFSTRPLAPLSFGHNYSSLYKDIYDGYRN
jgi:glycosyltransferase involved in cell wall biosynthesis